jgi:hypothetical protein
MSAGNNSGGIPPAPPSRACRDLGIAAAGLCAIVLFALSAALAVRAAEAALEKPPAKVRPGVFEKPERDYTVEGTVTTSDGKSASGTLYTALGKGLVIYGRAEKKNVEFTLPGITKIDVAVEEEHEEPYWYWRQSGSDEKVFTGKNYPWRKYVTTVTLADGKKITGDTSGIIFLEVPGKPPQRFMLHKRQSGTEGQKLSDLVYVKSITVEKTSPPPAGAPPAGGRPKPAVDRIPSTSRVLW